jgi:hypothetical protein
VKQTIFVSVISSIVGALVTVAAIAALNPPRAEAQSGILSGTGLELKDSAGRVRIRAVGGADGRQYTLAVLDRSGRARALVTADDDGAAFSVTDTQNLPRATLAIGPDNETGLGIFQPTPDRAIQRVNLGIGADGTASLQMRDVNNQTVLSLP